LVVLSKRTEKKHSFPRRQKEEERERANTYIIITDHVKQKSSDLG